MMSIHKLSAGDGYTYYLRETASADELRAPSRELGDYYLATGNPPGIWVGSGLQNLYQGQFAEGKLDASISRVAGTVTETQMRALFGEGIHPNADAMTAAGASKQQIKLGRGFYKYDGSETTFSRAVRAGFNEFKRRHKAVPTAEQRRVIRGTIGAKLFHEEHGRRPVSKEELGRFMTASETPQQQAVTGFDLTFAPAKSVSLVWALGGEEARKGVEKAHTDAIEASIKYLESRGIYTRSGYNGVEQHNVTGGIIATRFRHYDSRTGDPHLHDHLVVSNRVLSDDGKTWLTLDGQQLYKLGVEVSEFYNTTVMANVCQEVGASTTQRDVGGGRMVTEIAGVGEALIKHGSTRNTSIRKATRALVKEFRADHGYSPNKTQRIALAQKATLDTRPDKEGAHSPQSVSKSAVENFTKAKLYTTPKAFMKDMAKAHRLITEDTKERALQGAGVDVANAAEAVLDTVSTSRSVWGEHHVRAEALRFLNVEAKGVPVPAETVLAVTDLVLNLGSVSLAQAEQTHAEPSLHRADGRSIYAKANTAIYTSTAIIAAEDRLLTAAQQDVIPAASGEHFTAALAHRDQDPKAHTLSLAQQELAKSFALSPKLLTLGIGPAGTGKTTSMALAVNTINRAGGRVIGLAPSASAAAVLRADLLKGATGKDRLATETIAKFLDTHVRQGQNTGPHAIVPGDVIVIDEAGMSSTADFAAVVTVAERYGARVCAIGDQYQLSAVAAGGAFRLIAHQVGAVELEEVHRFRTIDADGKSVVNQAEADASLALRDPEKAVGIDAFAYYLDQGLVTAGDDQRMIDDAYASWQKDTNTGLISLMMAADRATVTELNLRAQAYRIASGTITGTRAADVGDGASAHAGDTVLARKIDRRNRMNQGKDFVKNGDLFTVKTVHRDGSLTVKHLSHNGTAHLAAAYVKEHLQLGYASTFNGAQGATVDTTASILRAGVTRAQAYVGATRGRLKNQLFTMLGRTDPNTDMPTETATRTEVLEGIAASVERNLSAHETIDTTAAQVHSVAKLRAEHINTDTLAQQARVKTMLRSVLGDGPAAKFIDSPAFEALAYRIRDAETKGLDAAWIIETAHKRDPYKVRGFSDAVTAGAVLSWRIERHTEKALEVLAIERPLGNLSDAQLAQLKTLAITRHAKASKHLANGVTLTGTDGKPVPLVYPAGVKPWNLRMFGNLNDETLEARIAKAENAALYFVPSTDGEKTRKNTWLRKELTTEKTLRASLVGAAAVSENAERGLLSVWAKLPVPAPEEELGPDMPIAGPGSPAHPAAGMAYGQTPLVFGPQPKPTKPRRRPASPGSAAKHTAPTVFDTSVGSSRRLSQAGTVLERILLEDKIREMVPTTTVRENAAAIAATLSKDGIPEWIAPTHALAYGLATGTLGETWSAELLTTRDTIAQELLWTGHFLAAEQPAWASALGPVPSEPEHRKAWKHTAALVHTFRESYNISGIEKDPIPAKFLQKATGKNQEADELAALVTAIHKYTGQTLQPAATEESLQESAAVARAQQLVAGRSDAQKLVAAHLAKRATRVTLSGLQEQSLQAHTAADTATGDVPPPTINDTPTAPDTKPTPTTVPPSAPVPAAEAHTPENITVLTGPTGGTALLTPPKPSFGPTIHLTPIPTAATAEAPTTPVATPIPTATPEPTVETAAAKTLQEQTTKALERAEELQRKAELAPDTAVPATPHPVLDAQAVDALRTAPLPETSNQEEVTAEQPESIAEAEAARQDASERESTRRERDRLQGDRDRHQDSLHGRLNTEFAQQDRQATATQEAERAQQREQARQEIADVTEYRAQQKRLAQVAAALTPDPLPDAPAQAHAPVETEAREQEDVSPEDMSRQSQPAPDPAPEARNEDLAPAKEPAPGQAPEPAPSSEVAQALSDARTAVDALLSVPSAQDESTQESQEDQRREAEFLQAQQGEPSPAPEPVAPERKDAPQSRAPQKENALDRMLADLRAAQEKRAADSRQGGENSAASEQLRHQLAELNAQQEEPAPYEPPVEPDGPTIRGPRM